MRRLALCASLAFALAAAFPASEQAQPAASEHGQEAQAHRGNSTTLWKVANFVLLAAGLGYLIHKKGGAFFRARTEQIRQAIADAARLREEAEARAAGIDQRLAGLEAEIEALRRNARQETAAEGERVRAQLRQDLDKLQAQAEQGIASAAQAARQELRRYAAGLAVSLAEQKVRAWMSAEIEDRLVAAAIQELGQAGAARPDVGRPA